MGAVEFVFEQMNVPVFSSELLQEIRATIFGVVIDDHNPAQCRQVFLFAQSEQHQLQIMGCGVIDGNQAKPGGSTERPDIVRGVQSFQASCVSLVNATVNPQLFAAE